jgi:hypothetical protein
MRTDRADVVHLLKLVHRNYWQLSTKRVYDGITDPTGVPTITQAVGYVGLAAFKDMVLEDE